MDRDVDIAADLLKKWAEWMRRDEPVAEGYPSKASGGFIQSWIKDSEELFDKADQREIEIINASVNSLNFIHQRVVYRVHGLGYLVWRFENLAKLYEEAKENFQRIYFEKSGK